MDLSTVKFVADSSCDVQEFAGVSFAAAPVKVITESREYADNRPETVAAMVEDIYGSKGRSSTSCPNEADWLTAFGDAETVFCATVTSALSGAYNSACMAKNTYEAEHPGRRVHVIDSLSIGAEVVLILEKVRECIEAGMEYDEVCAAIAQYQKKTGLLFLLESMKNLANNGRVSHLAAKAAGLLGIRVLGRASEEGTIEPIDKCRGEEKARTAIVRHLKELGYRGSKLLIMHCLNEEGANKLAERIRTEFRQAAIRIYPCSTPCSYYAERGGMIIGYESV